VLVRMHVDMAIVFVVLGEGVAKPLDNEQNVL
jgi:hypothetical protein